ncbi:Uncharacterised protein [uncultured archaeon]|nr:Uncharacterised protein [uncultured archaeon]
MESNLKYTVVMVLAFMLSGFMLSTYVFSAYSMLWDSREPPHDLPFSNPNNTVNLSNAAENLTFPNHETSQVRPTRELPEIPPFIPRRTMMRGSTSLIELLLSPFMMFLLIGGLISLSSAIAIRTLTHKKAIKKLKDDLTELYLTDEEKKVVTVLQSASSEMTQKELTDRMGYSRVKTHRVLQRLESKKIIRKIPNGQTHKILLEDKV